MLLTTRALKSIRRAAISIKAELQAVTLFDYLVSVPLAAITCALIYAAQHL